MRRKTLGLIVALLAAGCEDTFSLEQGSPDQSTELRSARRSRNSSCDADAGSVDALAYADVRGYDAGRVDAGSGNDSDVSTYDVSHEDVPIPQEEVSQPLCGRPSFALNRISPDDGITSYSFYDVEGNVTDVDHINWRESSGIAGIAADNKGHCYVLFELPRLYTVSTIPLGWCNCSVGGGPAQPCEPSSMNSTQVRCGRGRYDP